MTDNRIKQIADHYGLSIQLIQCASELNELGAEVTRLRLAKDTQDKIKALAILPNLAEELAGVEIMCEQVKYLLKLDDAVEYIKGQKLKRQMARAGLSAESEGAK